MKKTHVIISSLAIAASLASPLLGQFVYVANNLSNNVSGYTINARTGALTAIAGSPFPAGTSPASVAVDPTGRFLYVANNVSNNVSGYTINDGTGALTAIAGSPFPAGTSPASVAVDPTGQYVYVANSSNVSGYAINDGTGALTALYASPYPGVDHPAFLAVAPSGKFVYLTGGSSIWGFQIKTVGGVDTGSLTAIAGSPFPTEGGAMSLAIHPAGKFAYVASDYHCNVAGYTIDPAGALTAIAGSPFGASCESSVTVDPSGKFAYVVNHDAGNLSGYRINAGTGALTAIAGSPFGAPFPGRYPLSVAVDPTGQLAYVANNLTNDISGYKINADTGAPTVIAGAPFGGGSHPVSVAITGTPSVSCPAQQMLTAGADAAPDDGFGHALAMSGDTAVIGAEGVNPRGAYVFVRHGGVWSLQQKLTVADPSCNPGSQWWCGTIGFAVAVSGDTAVISYHYENDATGAVYVFVRHGEKWTLQQRLAPSDGIPGAYFGVSVAVSNDTVIVNAPGSLHTPPYSTFPPGTYVFERSHGLWSQRQKLPVSGGAVTLAGDTAIIGSYFENNWAGAAYVYVRHGGTWSLQQRLTAGADAAAYDLFGISTALDGDTAVIGAPDNTGAAYVFERRHGIWSLQQKLTATDAGGFFGGGGALDGKTAVIGGRSAAYAFSLQGGVWSQDQKLPAGSVAVSGDTVMVGTAGGAAFVFTDLKKCAK